MAKTPPPHAKRRRALDRVSTISGMGPRVSKQERVILLGGVVGEREGGKGSRAREGRERCGVIEKAKEGRGR